MFPLMRKIFVINFFIFSAEATIDYHRGLPRIKVPLPSRRESCIFTLKPITHTVGDFLEMLKCEDRGIDRASVTTLGERKNYNLFSSLITPC